MSSDSAGTFSTSISRKTDKGIPRYLDDEESDTYQVTGAEDLVPVLERNGNVWRKKDPTHPLETFTNPHRIFQNEYFLKIFINLLHIGYHIAA